MVRRKCTYCSEDQSSDGLLCESCGSELKPGGVMLESLVYWSALPLQRNVWRSIGTWLFAGLTLTGAILQHPAPVIAGILSAALAAVVPQLFKRSGRG